MRPLLVLLSTALLALLAVACRSGDPTGPPMQPPAKQQGSVVFGVTTDLRVGVDITSLHVVMHTGGAVTKDQTLTSASSGAPLTLPMELPFDDLADGTEVDVSLDAFGPGSSTAPLVSRVASTTVVGDKTLLFVLGLDAACATVGKPICSTPSTCVRGQCESSAVDPSTLPSYTPGWSQVSSDPCKPANAGAPIVVVGEGQADYLPLTDGEVDQVEMGPQGGHHVWVAIRVKNLTQSGSITSVTGHFPDLGIDVGPFNVIFTFDVDEGGYCKLYGLRFQLDEVVPISMLLGHPLDLTVTVTDADNTVGTGTKNVVLSTNYLM